MVPKDRQDPTHFVGIVSAGRFPFQGLEPDLCATAAIALHVDVHALLTVVHDHLEYETAQPAAQPAAPTRAPKTLAQAQNPNHRLVRSGKPRPRPKTPAPD